MVFRESSVRAVQYYKEIKQFYQSKARRKHVNVARNLVALELANAVYHVLKNRQDFNNQFNNKLLSRQKKIQWPRLSSPVV